MEIAICDDEKEMMRMTARAISKYCTQRNVTPSIYMFTSVRSLINYENDLDVIFLDIGFPDCDGIALSGDIRRQHKDARIVLLTCHDDRCKDGYKINAFRFLTKPLDERELGECLSALHKELGKIFTLSKNGINALLREKDIYYISAEVGFTEVWSENDAYRTHMSLSTLEGELPMGELFCRCHKKYIVNMRHIEKIDCRQKAIFMNNGTKILVSRRRLNALKDCFMQYDSNYNR